MPRDLLPPIEADGRDGYLRDGSTSCGRKPDEYSDGTSSDTIADFEAMAGADLGASVSEPKKRRGRPRKPVEIGAELPNPTLTEPPAKRGRKRGPDLSVLVETTVVGLFGLVAVATAHEHWLKERQDVMAITGPLNAWIDQLPAKTLKKLEANLAPALFVVGLATVVGPDVVLEMRLRGKQNARNPISRQSPGAADGAFLPQGGPEGAANGTGRRQGNQGGWHSGIPAVPSIGSEFDV